MFQRRSQPASTEMSDISREDLERILNAVDPRYEWDPNRRRLYEQGFRDQPHLPKLALQWFEEIASKGPMYDELWFSKRRPSEEERYGLPPFIYSEGSLETPPLDEVYRVRVPHAQTLLLWRGTERTPEGYKRMVVTDEFFRTDMATLAVLTTMEADRAKLRKPWEYEGEERELDFAEALLRYYRDGFEDLSPKVQLDLKVETYRRIHAFLEALRLLMAYLEYGEARAGAPTKPLTAFRRDARAAELKHIDGLKNREIAEKLDAEGLGLEEPKSYRDEEEKVEKYARKASDSAKRGREYLERALGERKLRHHLSRAKAEKEHFKRLDDVDRLMWALADKSNYVHDHVVRKLRHGDPNKEKRDELRKVLSRLLDGDRSVLEDARHTFNPAHVVKSSPPEVEEP